MMRLDVVFSPLRSTVLNDVNIVNVIASKSKSEVKVESRRVFPLIRWLVLCNLYISSICKCICKTF